MARENGGALEADTLRNAAKVDYRRFVSSKVYIRVFRPLNFYK